MLRAGKEMKRISVEIDHLVLDGVGVGPEGGPRLGRMLENRLQHLLEKRGLPDGLNDVEAPEIVVPDLTVPEGSGEQQTAGALALALYGALDGLG
jgi:hypothetical protein